MTAYFLTLFLKERGLILLKVKYIKNETQIQKSSNDFSPGL